MEQGGSVCHKNPSLILVLTHMNIAHIIMFLLSYPHVEVS
jgi:hypothetical protein